MIGVAASTADVHEIATAGVAVLVSGTVSMALGEQVRSAIEAVLEQLEERFPGLLGAPLRGLFDGDADPGNFLGGLSGLRGR